MLRLVEHAPTDLAALISEVEALREWQSDATTLLLAGDWHPADRPLALRLVAQAQTKAEGVPNA